MRIALVLFLAAGCGGGEPSHATDLSAAVDLALDSAFGLDSAFTVEDAAEPPDLASSSVGCNTPGLLFCEDFESNTPGTATSTKWTPTTLSASLTIDGTHAYGNQALHVHTDANGHAFIKPNTFAPPGNSFFGRMRAWVTEFPSGTSEVHFTMVEAAGTGNTTLVRPVGGQNPVGGTSQWAVGTDGGPTGDWLVRSPPTTPSTWVCLEWQLTAANDEVDVWIDGVPQPTLTVTETSHPKPGNFVFPEFDSIWFGFYRYQRTTMPTNMDLWLDDIVLSTTRIGC